MKGELLDKRRRASRRANVARPTRESRWRISGVRVSSPWVADSFAVGSSTADKSCAPRLFVLNTPERILQMDSFLL
ncbi:MAG: hypothetical protein AB1426_04630 [Bacillota bacterium]